MKKFSSLVALGWFFLFRGHSQGWLNEGDSATTIGPFQSQEQCERIAKEAVEDSHGYSHSTSCWEEKYRDKKEQKARK